MAKRYLVNLNKSGSPLKVEVVANSQKEAREKAIQGNPGYKSVSIKELGKA